MKIISLLGFVCVQLYSFFGIGSEAEIKFLTPDKVLAATKNKDTVIFDVNPLSIYQAGHVPTARHLEFSKIKESLPSNKNLRLIFYCKNEMCTASHYAAKIAVESGFKNVARMPEGIDGWIKTGFSIEGLEANQ